MNIIIISDLHLGHTRVPETSTINALKEALKPTLLREADLIVITGDIFDTSISMASETYRNLMEFFIYLGNLCIQYNIDMRWLEGTLSHDMRQGKSFQSKYRDMSFNFKYYDKISIELYNGYYLLFVPDEMEQPMKAIYSELEKRDIDKVDMAFMHGNFKYQLPYENEEAYDERAMLDITIGFIVIGHIHTHSTYERIIAPGSFDRLTFGQEEDKGLITIQYGNALGTSYNKYKFHVNPHATKFTTVKSDNENEILRHISKANKLDHLRFITNIPDVFNNLKPKCRIVIDKPKTKEEGSMEVEVIDMTDIVELHRGNIGEALYEFRKGFTDKNLAMEELKLVMNTLY